MSSLVEKFGPMARDLDMLEKRVRARETDAPTHTKRTDWHGSVVLPVDLRGLYGTTAVSNNPFMPLQREWVNGADDVYITEVGWTGYWETDTANNATYPVMGLVDSARGVTPGDQNAGGVAALFDFDWNYRLPRTGLSYVSAINGATYASRKAFGIVRGNRVLTFMDPLVLKSGDNIVWMLKPTFLNPLAVTAAANNYIQILNIEFWMSGYRSGTQAEADYERP